MRLKIRKLFILASTTHPVAILIVSVALAALGCSRLEPPSHRSAMNNSATTAPVSDLTPMNVDENNLALSGYDPVSYFDSPKPLKGSPAITAADHGAVYRFVSDDHRKLFLANPRRYAPAYGGFCAAGVAHGYKVQCDPTDYKVEDGNLYLFNKTLFFDAANGWDSGQKKAADQNWDRATGR